MRWWWCLVCSNVNTTNMVIRTNDILWDDDDAWFVRKRLLVGSCYSIFSFMWYVLYIVVCTFGHCAVCLSSIYGIWLSLWYLQTLLLFLTNSIRCIDGCSSFCTFSFGHCVVCPSFGHCVVCPSSFGHCVVCPSSFGHCVVCPSLIYGFWLPLWYFQTFLIKKFIGNNTAIIASG